MKDIHEIDPNFRLSGEIPADVRFYDPREAPFSLHGLVANEQGIYCRLPQWFLQACSEGVQWLSHNLSGACVRFATDAESLTVLWSLPYLGVSPHFTAYGQSGMQLFEEKDQDIHPVQNLIPLMAEGSKGCKQHQSAHFSLPGGMRQYALYLPLYNGLDSLLIGVPPHAQLGEGRMPKISKPIVFYGSSITQGACASKTGSCYTTLLCRRLDVGQINLGFSGGAKGEPSIAKYIASLSMSVFVMDYDYNAPSVEHLRQTHEPFFKIVREAHPEVPIVLISRPVFSAASQDTLERREVIKETWRHATEAGDKNVYFVDGTSFFGDAERDLCTIDGCHPNDLGFWHMANTLEPLLRSILK